MKSIPKKRPELARMIAEAARAGEPVRAEVAPVAAARPVPQGIGVFPK